jgi:hypothetical protein
MLAGKKPLAMFYEEIGFLPHEEIIPEERFAPYVKSGRFVRSDETYTDTFHPALGRNAEIKYVFLAIVEETWRIPALALLLRICYRTRNFRPEEFERMVSALLGYTDEEIDAWCEHCFRSNLFEERPFNSQ